MRGFGLSYEVDEDDESEDGIWEEHEAALVAFLRVQTQWRWVTPGDGSLRRVGLDYPGVRAGLDMAGIAMTAKLWLDLQLIEAGALAAEGEGDEA